jgi:hypothetical protein
MTKEQERKNRRGVSAYIGQKLLNKRMAERDPTRNDFGWKLGYAIDVLMGKCDVIVWEAWGEGMEGQDRQLLNPEPDKEVKL